MSATGYRSPCEDLSNFLADLYAEGYQSAISSTYEMVDKVSIGSHPTIKRTLKGVFHSRPPQPRYSSCWDANTGTMIDYLKKLDFLLNLDFLLLTQMTMKTAKLQDYPVSRLDIWMT